MPVLLRSGKKIHLVSLQVILTRMTMRELIDFEASLWEWVGKMPMENIAAQLNAIYREVEWRAHEKDWANAAHS